MVVKVVLDSLNLLIILMTLAGNQNHITRLGNHAGRAYGFTAVSNGYNLLHILLGKACQHIVDYILRLLKSGIIGSNDNLVTVFYTPTLSSSCTGYLK